VSITELSFTEQMFDPKLNPIRATVAITATVLTIETLGPHSRGGALGMSHLKDTERLASRATRGSLSSMGVSGL
jgi:hypothetical protein